MADFITKKPHVSAGALVVRTVGGRDEVLLLYRKSADAWCLPKGTLKDGELLEDAARREVEEETGVVIEIQKYLKKLESFKADKTPKITHYFLALPLSINLHEHDWEHDHVEFMEVNQALRKLEARSPYEKEYRVLQKYLKAK